MTQALAHPVSRGLEPAWDVARLFPPQGRWYKSDYLWLTANTNKLVELIDGRVEVLPTPTTEHQYLVQYLSNLLLFFAAPRKLGRVVFAALPVHTRDETFLEPDIVFMLTEHADRILNEYWEGADLVMEVVSPDRGSHKRDWIDKPLEYARAGIPEYWIVDPPLKKIVVLRLEGKEYVTHSEAGETGTVSSALLNGFTVDAAQTWAAGKI